MGGTEGTGAGAKSAGAASSHSGSRQTSRGGSPVSILKKGGSRDASRDRSGPAAETDTGAETTGEEGTSSTGGAVLSRTGSIKKSGSFSSRRTTFVEKKKISFDSDIDVEQLEAAAEAAGEPLMAAKEIFAAIANTSLEAGLSGRQQLRSRDASRERPPSRSTSGGGPSVLGTASPAEPADYYPPEGSEFDNEDELMIILDDEEHGDHQLMMQQQEDEFEPELEALKSRSASRERPRSRGAAGKEAAAGSRSGSSSKRPIMQEDKYPTSLLTKSRSGSGVPELEAVTSSMGHSHRSASGERWPSAAAAGVSAAGEEAEQRPSSTGFTHLDEFERKLAEMETELEDEPMPDMSDRNDEYQPWVSLALTPHLPSFNPDIPPQKGLMLQNVVVC